MVFKVVGLNHEKFIYLLLRMVSSMKEGLYTKRLKSDRVICSLCYNQCLISPDGRGVCRVRENKKGRVYTLNYQKFSDEKEKTIESLSLFHFLPGTKTYCIKSAGINLRNASFKEEDIDEKLSKMKKSTPDQMVKKAVKAGCSSITFNGEEPTMFFESMTEIAKIAKSKRLKTAVKTNGYIYEKPFNELLKHIHALNFELNSCDKDIFFKITNGKLSYVQKNIKTAVDSKIWVEIATEIIPNINDTERELRKIAEFIASLGENIPWHISCTDNEKETIVRALAKELGIKYVYTGMTNTICRKCKKEAIKRNPIEVHVKKGICEFCKGKIEGVF